MGLELVEIMMDIEDHFGVTIPDEVATNAATVADMHAAVVELLVLEGRRRSAEFDAEVYREMIKVLAKRTGIDPGKIRPESRWFGDIMDEG